MAIDFVEVTVQVPVALADSAARTGRDQADWQTDRATLDKLNLT